EGPIPEVKVAKPEVGEPNPDTADLGSAYTVKLPVEEREGGGEEGGGGGSDEREEGPPSGSRRGRHEAEVRFRMAWDTDVCRLHDSRPQARPMKELSSAFCRL